MTKEEKIKKAACKLLIENGYKKTDYTKIAEAAGETRSLVQYYFPEKIRIACAFFDYTLTLAINKLYEDGRSSKCDMHFGVPFQIGQLEFSFLQMTDGMRQLTREMLESRAFDEFVNRELRAKFNALYKEFGHTDVDNMRVFFFDSMYLGSLYNALCRGSYVDPVWTIPEFAEYYSKATGKREAEIAELLRAATLEQTYLFPACKKIYDQVLEYDAAKEECA